MAYKTKLEYSEKDLIEFAYYYYNGLTNIERVQKTIKQHLKDFLIYRHNYYLNKL